MTVTRDAIPARNARDRWRWFLALSIVLLLVAPPLRVELREPDRSGAALTLPAPMGDRFRVFVANWGYHTAIILEQPPGWTLGPPGEETAPFVEYAWGDRRFYMESNFWPHSVFATLMLPTESVAYVDGRAAPPTRGFRALYVREVSAAELRALASELEASIRRDASGARAAAFSPVTGYAGRFLPGIGSYTWWTNCNRWTVDRLAAAGLAKGGRGVIFSGDVAGRLAGFTPVRDTNVPAAPHGGTLNADDRGSGAHPRTSPQS